MYRTALMILALMATLTSVQARALALGPDEFAVARQMTCVLAEVSLGYLSDEQYAARTEVLLEEYDAADSDVIYAKAIGYFDGLMFGIPASDEGQVNERLRSFVDSKSCSMSVGVNFSL
jgi:hypothetical protein